MIHAESNAIAETAVDECIKNNTLTGVTLPIVSPLFVKQKPLAWLNSLNQLVFLF
ncbi:hypothetical protein J4731_02885 [Providencia rettgeri]|nr:hypothetical protein [Providencia rettgeri]